MTGCQSTPPRGGTTRNCDAAIGGPPSSPEYAHAVSTSRPRSDSTPATRANAPGHVGAHDGHPLGAVLVAGLLGVVVGRAHVEAALGHDRQRRRVGERALGDRAVVRAVRAPGGCARRGRRRAAPSTSPTPTARSPASRPRSARRAGRAAAASPTASATFWIVAGSVRSRRIATSGSSRWCSTMRHEHGDVVVRQPEPRPDVARAAPCRPSCGRPGSPCRCRGTGRRARAGRAVRRGRSSAAALAAVSHRCRSTVKRW